MREEAWLEAPGKAHFIGVCGVGMAGVAVLMAARGWTVTGCDAGTGEGGVREWLEGHGVRFLGGHAATHVRGVDVVVRTSAVGEEHIEVAAALAAGVRVVRRGEVLAAWMGGGHSVAVCGTHGKTTTSCVTLQLFQTMRYAAAWCIGGRTLRMEGVAGGPFCHKDAWLVAEADESDGTLAEYAPEVTVLTNIDDDHMEHFAGRAELEACFGACVSQTREAVVFGADDARVRRVVRKHGNGLRRIGFGFSERAELRAVNVAATPEGTRFDVMWRGDFVETVRLGVPGSHNVLNALAALGAVVAAGGDLDEGARRLSEVRELPLRRFECVAEAWRGARVISDYAHHPREIAALAKMVRAVHGGRVLAVFEPHRYSRTRALLKDFPPAFEGVDALALLPVYAASEAPVEGGRTLDLFRAFRKQRPHAHVALMPDKPSAFAWLKGCARSGDAVLLIGAGSVVEIAQWIREDRGGDAAPAFEHPDAVCVEHGSLEAWTTYRTPASARWRIEVKSFEAAQAVLRWAEASNIRTWWFGMGANTLVPEHELQGAAIRFAGNRGFLRDGAMAIVGCGWKGGALLERLTTEGLSGLEFLDSVPGQLGGWLAMNAGAHGQSINDCVAWIRALRPDGSLCILHDEEIGFAYRSAPGLKGLIAAEAGLRLAVKTPEEILAQRKIFRAKRVKLAKLRSAGSVFKNPAGDHAGRLIEAAGCKGKRIGGARVYRGHANIIVLDKHACASDVIALVAWVRERVRDKFCVTLEPEIVCVGESWNAWTNKIGQT